MVANVSPGHAGDREQAGHPLGVADGQLEHRVDAHRPAHQHGPRRRRSGPAPRARPRRTPRCRRGPGRRDAPSRRCRGGSRRRPARRSRGRGAPASVQGLVPRPLHSSTVGPSITPSGSLVHARSRVPSSESTSSKAAPGARRERLVACCAVEDMRAIVPERQPEVGAGVAEFTGRPGRESSGLRERRVNSAVCRTWRARAAPRVAACRPARNSSTSSSSARRCAQSGRRRSWRCVGRGAARRRRQRSIRWRAVGRALLRSIESAALGCDTTT